jgi:hypothetical protein
VLDPITQLLYEFETTEGDAGGAAGAAAAVMDDTLVDGGDVSAAADAPDGDVSDAADAPDGPEPAAALTPEQLQAPEVQQFIREQAAMVAAEQNEQLARQLAEALGIPQADRQPQGPPIPNPFSDDYEQEFAAYHEWMQQQQQAQLQQALAPYQQQETQKAIDEAVTAAVAAHPEVNLAADDVNRAGAAFLVGADGQFKPLEQAAKEGADWLAGLREQWRKDAVEEYKASLQGDGDTATPYEPGVHGSGLEGAKPPSSEMEVARRWRENARATPV